MSMNMPPWAILNKMIDYPGGINQDMVLHLWLQNPLKNGSMTLNGRTIDLKILTVPYWSGLGKPIRLLRNSQLNL